MRVSVTGASGLIGTALVRALKARGDEVVEVGRRGPVAWDPMSGPPPAAVVDVDAVVHLAGEPVAAKRWSEAQKRRIRESRVVGTRNLVAAINRATRRPRVLVSASGSGFYGVDRGEELLSESSMPGDDYLARLCVDWEAEAKRAETRVACLRTGLVLAREGGALPMMALPIRFFVGGPLGNGRQWTSWIHIRDHVGLYLRAIDEEGISGPLNAVAPNPVRNAELVGAVGRVLWRPTILPAPRFALELALGERAGLLLGSLRLRAPEGARFDFPELGPALRDLFDR